MERIACELVDVGVDWITATSPKTNQTAGLWTRALFWLSQEEKRGMDQRAWTFSGYRGLAAGSVQFGDRDDGVCFRLGSHMAKKNWRTVFETCRRASRIDLQYTLRFECDPAQIIARHYRQAKREKKRCPGGPSFSMFSPSDTSSTLYLGSRSSDVFMRIYDKWRESKSDAWSKCVRFEMELKNNPATSFAHSLLTEGSDGGPIIAEISRLLEGRGQTPWITETRRASFDAPLPASDDSRSLTWLATQVAPVLERLFEKGKGEEALRALKLLEISGTGSGVWRQPTQTWTM